MESNPSNLPEPQNDLFLKLLPINSRNYYLFFTYKFVINNARLLQNAAQILGIRTKI